MKMIFVLFFLISLVNLQDEEPQIKLGQMENNQCSTDIGKLNLRFKMQYSFQKEINSYFLLSMKDQNSQKKTMICKVELEGSNEDGKNSTEPEEDKKKEENTDKEKEEDKDKEKEEDKDKPKEEDKDKEKEEDKDKQKEEDEKQLDSDCQKALDDAKEQLNDIIKGTKLEEVAKKIQEFQENIQKDGLSEDLNKLQNGVVKIINGIEDSGLAKKLKQNLGLVGENGEVKKLYELIFSSPILEGNNEVMLAISGISLKLLKKSINKGELEERVKNVQNNYQNIKDFVQKIKVIYDLSQFISKLKIMNQSVELFPDSYKFIVYKTIYKMIKNFLIDLDISKIREEIKSMEIPENIKEIVGKLDILGQIGENIQSIFKAENIKEILDSKAEIKTLVDNIIHTYTDNTSLEPIIQKVQEIKNKAEEKINQDDSANKFLNFIQSAKQLNQTISDIKERLTLDNIIKSIREADISELQKKINEPIDTIAEKVKEKLNDEDVKLVYEKLKNVAQSKNLEEVNKALEELKDALKELKEKNKENKFGNLNNIFEDIKAKVGDSELLGDFKNLYETTKSFGETLNPTVSNIVKTAFKETDESIKKNIEKAKTNLEGSIDNLKQKLQSNLDLLKPIGEKCKEILESDDFDELKMHIKELKDLVLEIKDKLPEDSNLKPLLDKCIEIIEGQEKKSEFVDKIKNYMTDIKALKDSYESAKEQLKNPNLEEAKEKVKEVLDEYKQKADEKTKEINEKLANDFKQSKLYEVIKPYSDLIEEFKENMENLFESNTQPKLNKLKEFISNPQKLQDALEDYSDELGKLIKKYSAQYESDVKDLIKNSDLYKNLETLKVPFEDFSQKINDIKKEMSEKDFKDVMGEFKQSLGNANFDEFNNQIASIINNMNSTLKEVGNQIQTAIAGSSFSDSLNNYKGINDKLIQELKAIATTSPNLKEQMEGIINQLKYLDLQQVLNELNNLKDKIDQSITSSTLKLGEDLKALGPLLMQLAPLIANKTGISQNPLLNSTFYELLKSLSKLNMTSQYQNLKKNIDDLKIKLAEEMAQLKADDNTKQKLQKYSEAFKTYFTDLSNLEKPNIEQELTELSNILKNFKPTDDDITQLKLKLKDLSDEFKKQLDSVQTSLDDKFKDVLFYDEIKAAFANLSGSLKQIVESNSLKPGDFVNDLKDLSSKVLELRLDILESLVAENSEYQDMVDYYIKIKEFFQGLKDLINSNKDSNSLEEIVKEAGEYIKNFDTGKLDPKTDLKEFATTLVEKLKETELFKQYEDYKDKYQDYKDLVKDMQLYMLNYTVNETVDKVRDFLKIFNLEEIKNKGADLLEQIKDNEKAQLVKEKLEAISNSKSLPELKSAVDDCKKTLLEIAKEQVDNSNLKSLIEKLQELQDKNKENIENSETYKYIKECTQNLNDFKDKINGIVENMQAHTWGKLQEGIEKGFDKFKGDLIEFTDAIEDKLKFEDFKAIKDKIGEIKNSQTVGELIDHNKELKQILDDISSKYAGETNFKKNVDKIKEFNEKVKDKIYEFVPLEEVKEVSSSLNDLIDNLKENARNVRIYTINSTIQSIKSKLKEVPPKIEERLSNTVDNLPKMVDGLEKAQEKLQALNQTKLNMCIQRELNKLKTTNLRNRVRVLEESNLLCKYDEVPTEATTFTASSSDLNILNNETYSLSLNSELKLSVESYKSKPCNEDHIQNMKKQISFKKKEAIAKEPTKKRIKFKIKITIKKTYKVTKFFYVKMKIKVRYKKTSLLRQLDDVESDSFCIPSENEDFTGDEADLDCFTLTDNPDDVENVGDFSSDTMDIPDNSTSLPNEDNNSGDGSSSGDSSNSGNNSNNGNSDNNGNNTNNENSDNNGNNSNNGNNDNNNSTNIVRPGIALYRSKSSNLSSGAIVGIVLGCVAALAIIIALIILSRKNAPVAPIQNSVASNIDSRFNMKV